MIVPEGWSLTRLSKIGSILKAHGGSKADASEGGMPCIRYGELYTHHEMFIKKIDGYVGEERASSYFSLKRGDVLFAGSGETHEEIGKSATYTLNQTAVCGGDILVFRPGEGIHPEFLGYATNSTEACRQKARLGQGSSVIHLYAHHLAALQLLLPPLPEQKKIAAILSSVDETIQATRETIEQTKKVKQGLMQELLPMDEEAHGIQGKIRLLDKEAIRVTGHTPDKKHPEYWNGNVKWVSLTDSSSLDHVYISDTCKYISNLGIANSSATPHPPGTVILTRDAGVGKSAILADTMAVSQHFVGWICGPLLDPLYLYYWLQRRKRMFERIAVGSTIKTIGMPFFKKLKISLIPIERQKQIAKIINQCDIVLQNLDQVVTQLNVEKNGLMQDLLTGKVRVVV